MSLSLGESQTINKVAELLYSFLPGKPHPFANQEISFQGVAHEMNLGQFWSGGSKLPAITVLLEKTLTHRRDRFCDLVLATVRKGLIYRNKKGEPVTYEEIKELNELILGVKFKIPELWEPSFLNSLPRKNSSNNQSPIVNEVELDSLKKQLMVLDKMAPQPRGFAFEKFLNTLFGAYELAPRKAFRLIGEQIDGSFQFEGQTYLVEAKWQTKQTNQADLLVFKGKVEAKSTWSRGIFISYSGFTDDGLAAFSRGRATNIVGITGQDLYFVLEGKIPLTEVLSKKIRRAAETGEFLVTVYELSLEN